MSLRTATTDNVVIIDQTDGRHHVIGEVDRFGAPLILHEQAIYLHESKQFQVEKLDWENAKAYVREVNVDYYTDAGLAVRIRVLAEFASETEKATRAHGEVLVSALATVYKKLTLFTHENVGWGKIHLPEQELQTTSFWLALPETVTRGWPKE